MKGPPVPSRADLARAYESAARYRAKLEPRDAVAFAQWSRLDARLGEILAAAVADRFASWNPYELFRLNAEAAFPQSLLVICEFARLRVARSGGRASRKNFDAWFACVSHGASAAAAQSFFLPTGAPKPDAAIREFSESLAPYKRWGYAGRDDLSGEKGERTRASRTLLEKPARAEILRRLLRANAEITVSGYVDACGGRIHRRTAERDLRECGRLRSAGRTRGRVYRKAGPRGGA